WPNDLPNGERERKEKARNSDGARAGHHDSLRMVTGRTDTEGNHSTSYALLRPRRHTTAGTRHSNRASRSDHRSSSRPWQPARQASPPSGSSSPCRCRERTAEPRGPRTPCTFSWPHSLDKRRGYGLPLASDNASQKSTISQPPLLPPSRSPRH